MSIVCAKGVRISNDSRLNHSVDVNASQFRQKKGLYIQSIFAGGTWASLTSTSLSSSLILALRAFTWAVSAVSQVPPLISLVPVLCVFEEPTEGGTGGGRGARFSFDPADGA